MRVEKFTRRSRRLVALLLAVLLFAPISVVRGQTPLHTISNPGPEARFGQAFASIGDVDGDGAPDFAVGAPFAAGQGQVFVLSGALGSMIRTLNHPDGQAQFSSAAFGWSVAGMGDVNGDGIPDFAVGAPGQSVETPQGTIFVGRAFVFSGADGSRLFSVGDLAPTGGLGLIDSAMFGWAIASVNDLDGDGVRELAVGAPAQGVNSEGQVFVFSGANGSLIHVLDNPTQSFGFFGGGGLAGVGDVNADGVDDLAVGAPEQDEGQGRVFVFSGNNGGFLAAVDSPTPQANAHFGEALTMVGDVNGDGLADLAVGAPRQHSGGVSFAGRVFVFSGVQSSSGVPFSAASLMLDVPISPTDPPPSGASFGQSLAAVGDYDGDGVPDIAVGAPNYSISDPPNRPIDTGAGVGKVFIFSGAAPSLPVLVKLDNPGDPVTGNANYGHQVAVVENAGGGVRYLVVSAPFQPDLSGQIGQAFVYSLPEGNSTPPPPPTSDTTPPTLQNLPGPVVAEATEPAGAVVNYPNPTAIDNEDPTPVVSCVPTSGSTFPLGSTPVTCTARDRSGNGAYAGFQVTVRDSTPPDTIIRLDASVVDGQGRRLKPGDSTLSTAITVEFVGTDAVGVASYQCSWDSRSYSSCSSPINRSNLSIGKHTFRVRTLDGAGLTDPSPATFEWTILSKGQAAKELKRSAKELELSRRERAKLQGLLREIKERLTDRRRSNDKKVCDELGDVTKLLAKQERAGVLTNEETAPLHHLADSLRLNIGCRVNKSWHAGHRHR